MHVPVNHTRSYLQNKNSQMLIYPCFSDNFTTASMVGAFKRKARAQILLFYDAQSKTRGLVTSFETLVIKLLILDNALYNRKLLVGC